MIERYIMNTFGFQNDSFQTSKVSMGCSSGVRGSCAILT
jgi:hypothetical protein